MDEVIIKYILILRLRIITYHKYNYERIFRNKYNKNNLFLL